MKASTIIVLVAIFTAPICLMAGVNAPMHLNVGVNSIQTTSFDPNNPAGLGYQLVFDDEFDSLASIDMLGSRSPAFKWYTTPFFVPNSQKITPSLITINNGILTLESTPGGTLNGNIATAAPAKNLSLQGWVGKTFGGGGYFEAKIAFDPATVDTKNGWPSFWSMSIEHMAGKNADQWQGQANWYSHFIEDDFFEYDTASFAGQNSYGATMHDWYGIWKKTCPSDAFCHITNILEGGSKFNNAHIRLSQNVDWTKFHIIGQLWVPSNKTNKTGYVQNYLDGIPTSKVSWNVSANPMPPPQGDAIFSIMDTSHLVVILGTGIKQPLHVDWVRVWQ
jgi:hypothetical protein